MIKPLLVLATHPDLDGARKLAATLVEERLAACVQVLPGVHSTYRWEGSVETAEEVRIEVKTSSDRLDELRERLVDLHPYDVPELVAVPIEGGLEAYLSWVRESTS